MTLLLAMVLALAFLVGLATGLALASPRPAASDLAEWHDGFRAGQRAGLHAGLCWFGENPQHKLVRAATLDELTGKVES